MVILLSKKIDLKPTKLEVTIQLISIDTDNLFLKKPPSIDNILGNPLAFHINVDYTLRIESITQCYTYNVDLS